MLLAGLAIARAGFGDVAEAERLAQEASVLVEQSAIAPMRPVLALAHSSVALARGDLGTAAELLERGADDARSMGATHRLWQLRAGRAGALRALSRIDEADAETAAASRVVDEMASRIADEHLRDSFLATSHARLQHLAGLPAWTTVVASRELPPAGE